MTRRRPGQAAKLREADMTLTRVDRRAERVRDEATARVREFYDGPADTIYKTTWGENLHLAVPRGDGRFGRDAVEHSTELMAAQVLLNADTRVLDLG